MSNVTTVGIDLAKNVFSLHGVDASGAVVLRKTVSRARLMELVAQQPTCLLTSGHDDFRRWDIR
jgi:transposase